MSDIDRMMVVVEPVVERAGAELVNVELGGSRGRPVVRVYVDKEAGVTLDDCARLSRLIERELESSGTVPERYVLEVSSPGIERPLSRRRDFERFVGREIAVRLRAGREGRKRFTGVLEGVVDQGDGSYAILVRDSVGGTEDRWTFGHGEIANAKLHVDRRSATQAKSRG
jgi:ribosome maturation factor RimP